MPVPPRGVCRREFEYRVVLRDRPGKAAANPTWETDRPGGEEPDGIVESAGMRNPPLLPKERMSDTLHL